jgi:hypothetical protein
VFTALAFALSLMLHAPLAVESTLFVAGQRTEREFLRGALGSLHQAVEFVNQLPEDSRVALYDEPRGFYFDRDYFWANPGQHNMIQYDRLRDGDELADTLRRFRVTHVLVNFAYFAPGSGHTETDWYRLLRDAVQRGRLEEVFRTDRAEMERRGIIVYELN